MATRGLQLSARVERKGVEPIIYPILGIVHQTVIEAFERRQERPIKLWRLSGVEHLLQLSRQSPSALKLTHGPVETNGQESGADVLIAVCCERYKPSTTVKQVPIALIKRALGVEGDQCGIERGLVVGGQFGGVFAPAGEQRGGEGVTGEGLRPEGVSLGRRGRHGGVHRAIRLSAASTLPAAVVGFGEDDG
jgi:hypothetical protein